MRNLLQAFFGWLAAIISGLCNEVAEGFRQRDSLRIVSNIIMIALYFLALFAGSMGVAWLIVTFKDFFILAAIVVAFIAHFVKKAPAESLASTEAITAVQERAEQQRKPMAQAAYVLLNELRIYLPGLPPLALNSVEADPPYIISPARTIIHYMRVMKGNCVVDVDTIAELIETIIAHHLKAKDLPLAVVEEYTAVTGEKSPGLVVDGVHDMGNFYRIDLAIADDAEAVVYAKRHAPKTDGVNLTVQATKDEDFG